MKYLVTFGVNNSHLTELKLFPTYKKAKKFFEGLTGAYEAKVCFKLNYSKIAGQLGEFVTSKEVKLFKFENGTNVNAMLKHLAA